MSDLPNRDISRRAVILGAAAVPLAACARPGVLPESGPPTTGEVLAEVVDVPVGSGKIVDGTLITLPSAGVFNGFAARCTHAGCALTGITDGVAVCPCHGSRFALDGAVVRGPAVEPLTPRAVTVRAGRIVAG